MRSRTLAIAVGVASLALVSLSFQCLADGSSGSKSKGKKIEPVKFEIPADTMIEIKPELEAPVIEKRPNGSLWNSGGRALTEDFRARRVGDLLTIIVQENTTASSSATTKSDKSDTANFAGGTGFLRRFLKDFGASAAASSSGSGATTRSGSLTARLTVMVKEVLANGNLVVEGMQTITVNKETQKVLITGTVRPQDIAQDNSVLSPQLANASIHYDGKGTVGDKQRKGILGRIFDLIF